MKRIGIVLAVVLLLAAGCGDDGEDGVVDTTTTAPPTTAPSTTTSVPAGDAVGVNVYFVRNELVATAGRAGTAPARARGGLTELLAGPRAS